MATASPPNVLKDDQGREWVLRAAPESSPSPAAPDTPPPTFKAGTVPARVLKSGEAEVVIYGPASVEIVDREGDRIAGEALNKALPQLLRRARFSLQHYDILPGEILPEFKMDDGSEYKTEVRPVTKADLEMFSWLTEKGVKEGDLSLFCVGKVWSDTSFSRETQESILKGELNSFSISGQATAQGQRMERDGFSMKLVNEITGIDLSAVTICKEGMNQAAKFVILRKSWIDQAKAANPWLEANHIDGSCGCPLHKAAHRLLTQPVRKSADNMDLKLKDLEQRMKLSDLESRVKKSYWVPDGVSRTTGEPKAYNPATGQTLYGDDARRALASQTTPGTDVSSPNAMDASDMAIGQVVNDQLAYQMTPPGATLERETDTRVHPPTTREMGIDQDPSYQDQDGYSRAADMADMSNDPDRGEKVVEFDALSESMQDPLVAETMMDFIEEDGDSPGDAAFAATQMREDDDEAWASDPGVQAIEESIASTRANEPDFSNVDADWAAEDDADAQNDDATAYDPTPDYEGSPEPPGSGTVDGLDMTSEQWDAENDASEGGLTLDDMEGGSDFEGSTADWAAQFGIEDNMFNTLSNTMADDVMEWERSTGTQISSPEEAVDIISESFPIIAEAHGYNLDEYGWDGLYPTNILNQMAADVIARVNAKRGVKKAVPPSDAIEKPMKLGNPAYPFGPTVTVAHNKNGTMKKPENEELLEFPAGSDRTKDSANDDVATGTRPKGFYQKDVQRKPFALKAPTDGGSARGLGCTCNNGMGSHSKDCPAFNDALPQGNDAVMKPAPNAAPSHPPPMHPTGEDEHKRQFATMGKAMLSSQCVDCRRIAKQYDNINGYFNVMKVMLKTGTTQLGFLSERDLLTFRKEAPRFRADDKLLSLIKGS